ncbi:MAG: GTPase HflX [Alphaproteobacteria bacterium]|nr:GTPase HflX [Alphaproteobacteria bacterium]
MSQKAWVISPYQKKEGERSSEAKLEEAVGLSSAIDLEIIGRESIPVREIRPATYLGKGSVERLKEQIEKPDVVIMDCTLSPIQQRNLEKEWQTKVIDRTALILEIFGKRAQTKEGVLQVELAHLTYQRSRLVRSWTHLERQRGGMGFLGGPGETQIEIDRRLIDERLMKIKKELKTVESRRTLHRKSRQKIPFPVVALVGYTNAGKSTLFNRLTKADVFAKDLLFATLDPTMRQVELPSGKKIILSDTVGFISNLPHELVAAFKATLEEVLEAELILHIRDASHEDTDIQKSDVQEVLKELSATGTVVEVMNKIDKLSEDDQTVLKRKARDEYIPVSALDGLGIDTLLHKIDSFLKEGLKKHRIRLDAQDGKTLAWLYEKGCVEAVEQDEDYLLLEIMTDEKQFQTLLTMASSLVLLEE